MKRAGIRFSVSATVVLLVVTLLNVGVHSANLGDDRNGHLARADYLAMSGAELYGRFCASCHGRAGQGDGPVAKSLTVEVPDLTLIARRQGGKFPNERIERIIDGRFVIGAHGTRTMPLWGEELIRTEIGNPDAERVTELIVRKLVDHVRSLQRAENGAKD